MLKKTAPRIRAIIHSPSFRYTAHVLLLTTYLLLGFRLFRLVSKNAVNLFTWDQWDFNNATLFQEHSLWEIFRWQHGPHRQGLGGLLGKLLEPAIHWNTRYESFGILGIVLLASVLALVLKKRLHGPIAYEDIVIPLLFLTPIQYEILIGTTNPAHGSLPLLLMVLFCLSWTITAKHWKYFCVLLVNFVMIYTGFGLFIGIVTPALIVLDYYGNMRHRAWTDQALSVAAFGISVASLMSFFVGYIFTAAADCFAVQPKTPTRYLQFAALMFANFIEVKDSNLVPFLMGTAILVAMLAILAICVKSLLSGNSGVGANTIVITALSSYCLVFALNTAYGRLCFGLNAARVSRYTPYLITGFFALYLYALSIAPRVWRTIALSAVCLLGVLSSARLHKVDGWVIYGVSRSRREWRDCYLACHDIQKCDSLAKYPIYPNPQATHLQEKLDFLERRHLNLFSEQK